MKRLLAVLLFLLALTLAADGHASTPIAILASSDEPTFGEVAASFTQQIKQPVRRFNLQGVYGNAAAVMPQLLASNPRLILALGAKAAVAAKKWTRDQQQIPVLFAKVIDWQMYDLLAGQNNIMGIANEISPAGYFTTMTMLTPSVRRIGVIHGEGHNQSLIHQAGDDAKKLGLKLVVATITRPKDFMLTFKRLEADIDGYWQLLDPTVSTLDNISWLRQRCIKNRIVCLGSTTNMTSAGLLLGLGHANVEIGAQAAAIAKRVFEEQQQPAVYGVVNPFRTSCSVNLKTASSMDLPIDTQTIAHHNDLSLWLWPVDKTFVNQTSTAQ